MSSAYNHMKRSHRSERMRKTTFAGFKQMPKPGKQSFDYSSGLRFGLTAIMNYLRQKKGAKKEA